MSIRPHPAYAEDPRADIYSHLNRAVITAAIERAED